MPEIIVKITQGTSEGSITSTKVHSNDLPALLTALKTAKEESNTVLTKLVEASKNQQQLQKDEEEDEPSSEDDDESTGKKLKSQ